MLGENELVLEVRVMQPKSHSLQVQWWVQPAASLSAAASGPGSRAPWRRVRGEARDQRGALPAMEGKPFEMLRKTRRGSPVVRVGLSVEERALLKFLRETIADRRRAPRAA